MRGLYWRAFYICLLIAVLFSALIVATSFLLKTKCASITVSTWKQLCMGHANQLLYMIPVIFIILIPIGLILAWQGRTVEVGSLDSV